MLAKTNLEHGQKDNRINANSFHKNSITSTLHHACNKNRNKSDFCLLKMLNLMQNLELTFRLQETQLATLYLMCKDY